ncbi:MAG: chalcone isomerase family protein [Opitutus sp.]|nr:chalcone isomerase family protein [Opitutus sp.]MCS6247436.1 chalcone isomerase family protein [Opitutus sp.]MCS6273041.1 chalcone isomerase family protein [Opitutus sp.]MCS6276731.1 chalcone isomerase family protein [Opitutus sp.]MCS6301620.1 chalcone isomerase family protein [Opitutus sp.]
MTLSLRTLLLTGLLACAAPFAAASEPPHTAALRVSDDAQETTLPLRGNGLLRWKWLVRLYHASLYLAPSAIDAVSAAPKRLRMDYLHGFSRAEMVHATEQTIGRNIDAATLLTLQPSLAKWNALYPAIKVGDCLEFDHLSGGFLIMRHNGTVLGSLVDEVFAQALFAIWIGANPVDRDLRQKLIQPQGSVSRQ